MSSPFAQNNLPAEGKLLRLYLKKLVWEGASDFPSAWSAAPQINLDFGHGNSPIAGYEDCYEVWLELRVSATMAGKTMYFAEIIQAGMFRLTPVRSGRLEDLFAWCSGVLYAQTLRVLALTMRNGGFDPLPFHDRSFSRAFLIDAGGPIITLGRLSNLGEIMPKMAALRLEAPVPVLQGDWPLFRSAVYAVLGTCAGFYLLFVPGDSLYRFADSFFAPSVGPGFDQPTLEAAKPLALPLEAEEKIAEPGAGLPLSEDGGQTSETVPALTAVPQQDHTPARYAAALESGARWLNDQPEAYFTLQVGALKNLEELVQIIGRSRFDDPIRLLRSVPAENGTSLYLILVGSYSSEPAAAAAARKLRESDAALAPQVKSFAAIVASNR